MAGARERFQVILYRVAVRAHARGLTSCSDKDIASAY
jgi:hypothetical protein